MAAIATPRMTPAANKLVQQVPVTVAQQALANSADGDNMSKVEMQAPFLLAASSLVLALAAVIIKLFRPTEAPAASYSMLLTSAARSEREKREQEKEAAKKREIQERLARLASMGVLPADHPVSAAPAAPARSTTAVRPPQQNLNAKQREVQERLARLARNGFSVPQSVSTGSMQKAPPANLTMHVYDHCPYCIRVELFLGWKGVKYNRVVYGYGDMEGPKKYIGKKQLPVLTGDGAPYPAGMSGMPESLDMINWLSKDFGLTIPPATGRKDYSAWQKKAKNTIAGLMRPRLLKMPFRDFQTKADVDYATAKWAKKGYNVEEAWRATPQLLVEMEALLRELEPMLQGEASLNPGGLGMDDIFLLPDLRRLTVVRDLRWPPKVRQYVDKALAYPAIQCVPYTQWAF